MGALKCLAKVVIWKLAMSTKGRIVILKRKTTLVKMGQKNLWPIPLSQPKMTLTQRTRQCVLKAIFACVVAAASYQISQTTPQL